MRTSRFVYSLAAMSLYWSLFTLPVQAQTQFLDADVPAEQVEGTLLPPEQPFFGSKSELSPGELKALGVDKGVLLQRQDVLVRNLPPIFVTMESGSYEQIAVTVPVQRRATTYPAYRRRSLSSRGGHAAPKPVAVTPSEAPTSRVVYRNVYRSSRKSMDISPVIEKHAEKYQLDPWLLRGVIEVESAFRPRARSCAGAGGLMQLMPGTASYLGCRDRFDPDQNIAAGAKYLRMMVDRFGNYDLAIAAYNAGPGNVARYGGIPPFAETQNYVRKVKKAWQWRPDSK